MFSSFDCGTWSPNRALPRSLSHLGYRMLAEFISVSRAELLNQPPSKAILFISSETNFICLICNRAQTETNLIKKLFSQHFTYLQDYVVPSANAPFSCNYILVFQIPFLHECCGHIFHNLLGNLMKNLCVQCFL